MIDYNTTLKYKKLDERAELKRGTKYSAGVDIKCISYKHDIEEQNTIFSTGISIEIPKGLFGLLVPRSSISKLKQKIPLSNTVGIIDSDYRGEVLIKVPLISDTLANKILEKHYFQIVFIPTIFLSLDLVDNLTETERGVGGFGSTN